MSLRNILGVCAAVSLTAMAAHADVTVTSGGAGSYGSDSNVTFTYSGVNGPLSGTAKKVKGGSQGYYGWADLTGKGFDWVSSVANGELAGKLDSYTGEFTYTVTFMADGPGAIFGTMYSDDYLKKVVLNGTPYNDPFTSSMYNLSAQPPWLNPATLYIGSGVVSGLNTLSFTVNNSGANTAGVAFNLQVVPEPGEVGVMLAATTVLGGLILRRRKA